MEMYIQGKKSGKIKSLSDAIFTNDCTMFEKVRKHKGIYLYARRNFLTYDKLLYSIYVWREATLNILYNISFVGVFFLEFHILSANCTDLMLSMSIYKYNRSTKTNI